MQRRRSNSNRARDSRLHSLLKQASGTKPLGLKTFSTPDLKLRRIPKQKQQTELQTHERLQQRSFTGRSNQSLTVQALQHHTVGRRNTRGGPSIPPLNIPQTRSRRRAGKSKKFSARPSTVASWAPEDGPSTLRRRVEAGKRSEWAQIVTKDLQNFREETAFVKQQQRKDAKAYAQEIRQTINLRATLNNPDVANQEKNDWRKVLEKEQTSNDIVRRAQMSEDKRRALKLKRDRDKHVTILRRKRKEEEQYHENWNQKIVEDAQQSVALSAQVRKKKVREEREYLQRTMKEHHTAKGKLIAAQKKQLAEEQRIQNNHNAHVKGKYVTESQRRKKETQRIDLIQTRLMKMGETWVGRDAEKREKEQAHFANKIEGPTGGTDYEVKAARLLKKQKKRQMMYRRRELLEQMVAKKERKLKEQVKEADFALTAAAEKVKAGMYQAFFDEEKLRSKDQYAHELKKQMERRRKIKNQNPSGMHARMTEAERTLNRRTLATMGIGAGNGKGGKEGKGGKGGKGGKNRRGNRSTNASARVVVTGRGPESQIFLSTYEDDEKLASQSGEPRQNTTSAVVSESPFHVDTVQSGNARSATPFHGYRRSRDTAHEELMKSSRPGTSGASLYSSLRHSHNPRRSKSWFDDEL